MGAGQYSSPDFPNRKARYSKDGCDLLPAAKLNLFRWQSMRGEATHRVELLTVELVWDSATEGIPKQF
jgi:hypothetical protein